MNVLMSLEKIEKLEERDLKTSQHKTSGTNRVVELSPGERDALCRMARQVINIQQFGAELDEVLRLAQIGHEAEKGHRKLDNYTVVAIRDEAAGNESVGEMWQETEIFKGGTPVAEVMNWAGTRKKRVTLTVPESSDFPKAEDIPF